MKTQTTTEPRPGLARRAFLSGLAVTLPISATAATAAWARPEAQSEIDTMIALRDRWRELNGQISAFEDSVDAAELRWRTAWGERRPAELTIRKADRKLFKQFFRGRWRERTVYDKHDVADMRGRQVKQNRDRYVKKGLPIEERELPISERFDPPGNAADYEYIVSRVPWPLAQARLESIVAACDRWEADKVALRESMGLDDAEEKLETHQDKVDEAVEAMITATATTIAALQMKAGLTDEWHDDDGDMFENWRAVGLMRAILTDIAKLSASSGTMI